MATVSLRNLHKRYDSGFHAVRGIALEIQDGEFLVLVGPSGCGKSTTLRMVAGLEEVSEGEIRIGDRVVNDVAPGDRDIAMVFQNYALYPHLTVRDNMAFGLRMRGMARAEIDRRVGEAAAALSIEPLLTRRPRELSGGQRQRVALGRAIVRDPAVFLFDEPLSNLDAKLRVQMRAELARLHRRLGTTVIYVTHDQVEAMTLGDRIVLMNQGVIQQADTPLAIYREPVNRFVASFIGSPTMNFFPGRIEADHFAIDGSAVRVPLGPEAARLPSGPAVLGVRPEDLVIVSADTPGGQPLATVPVDVVEQTGYESLAHFLLAGADHVVRLPGDVTIRPGDNLPLAIRPGGLHLFAADATGRRLG
jgi:multiple sugar transport system ATP-binding protein